MEGQLLKEILWGYGGRRKIGKGLHIAADVREFHSRVLFCDLGAATDGRGTDNGTGGEVIEGFVGRAGFHNEGVAGVWGSEVLETSDIPCKFRSRAKSAKLQMNRSNPIFPLMDLCGPL